MSITWQWKAIGYSKGLIQINGRSYPLDHRASPVELSGEQNPETLEITSEHGKFADSEDSFLYCFFQIDPRKENVKISAKFEVLDMDMVADNQTGFGILAADTVYSEGNDRGGANCVHRNHLLLGRFRTADGNDHGFGLRAVGGYKSAEAAEYEPVRRLDPTRIFDIGKKEGRIRPGDTCRLCLCKTDDGFQATLQIGEETETITFPGCSFLMQQDSNLLSIGFAAARKIRLRISDISVALSDGKYSETPEDAVRCVIPDYPFRRDLFEDGSDHTGSRQKSKRMTIYASPEGKPDQGGSETAPMDLRTALAAAGEGAEIILLDGVYILKKPLYLPTHSGGSFQKRTTIRSQHARRAILDGSELVKKAPLMILRGRYWLLDGLVFQNSPLSGLMICGSGNQVHNCEARHNGDTGILICAYPGDERESWPAFNQVEDSDSFDNCDPVMCNADGFGAKLSIGQGNGFYRCIAHHNIDDGFDLYTKSIFGPTEPVVLEQCIAYENGKTLENQHIRKNHSGGIGFKLGGENQAVAHEVWDCMAFLNQQHGFSSNSNPAVRLHYCTALENGRKNNRDDFVFYCVREKTPPRWVKEGLIPAETIGCRKSRFWSFSQRFRRALKRGERPRRREDGTIDLLRLPRKKACNGSTGAAIDADRNGPVLMMITHLSGGGAERVTTILASELSKGHPVYLLQMYNNRPQTYPIAPGVHVIDGSWSQGTPLEKYLKIRWKWPFKALTILRTKQKYHIDATISMLQKPNQYNGLVRWRDRRIMSERNDPSRKPIEEFRDAKRSFARADYVVFQSVHVQKLFSEEIQAKSTIIRNPISVPCFADEIPEHRIVTVGRYTEQKNHELLIRAFHSFHFSHPDYTLHLYGDGTLRGRLQEQINELQLQDAVFLEGFRDDIHEQIKSAKMFVLSSDYEGMSNALMEAMMMGLPCISTDCTGSDELLEDGKTGLLVPCGDADALASAMNRVADDEELCRRLRDQAQLQSLDFELGRVVRNWERIMFR